jgi:hypothetical protein
VMAIKRLSPTLTSISKPHPYNNILVLLIRRCVKNHANL